MSRALSSMGGEGVVGGGLTTYLKHIVHVYVYVYLYVCIHIFISFLFRIPWDHFISSHYHLSKGSGMKLESQRKIGNFAFVVWHIHQNHCALLIMLISMFTTLSLVCPRLQNLFWKAVSMYSYFLYFHTYSIVFLKNNPLIIQSLMLPMDLGNQQTLPTRRRRRCHAWVVVVVASPELVMDERNNKRDRSKVAVLRICHELLGYGHIDWLDEMW